MFLVAQICGFINFVTYGISIWMKKKKDILLLSIICNLADIIQYLCLGAYTACSINVISLIRNVLFRCKCNKVFFVVVISLYLVCGVLTFDGCFSALSILIVIIQTMLVYQEKEQYIRLGAVFIILYWAVYDFIYGAYVAVICDGITFISNVLSVRYYDKKPSSQSSSLV